jgi:hypothetical protein
MLPLLKSSFENRGSVGENSLKITTGHCTCVGHFSVAVTNYLRKQQDLFSLTTSGVSVQGHLAPLLLGCGESERHGGEHVVEHRGLLHGRQRRREGKSGMSPVTHFQQPGPTY